MSDPIREQWISEIVPGKSFAEVGGLRGTIHEQVTVAARAGATSTTMIDVEPEEDTKDLWQLFRERAASLGVTDARCIVGSIDDPEMPARIGVADVVHCSGVLYHCPDPLHTLQQLRRIVRETLILGTATIPDGVTRTAGSVTAPPGSALLVPAMTEQQRVVLGDWLRANGATQALGINAPLQTDWAVSDYTAWWWFFTVDYVSALLKVAGFNVINTAGYWDGRATFYHAEAASPAAGA